MKCRKTFENPFDVKGQSNIGKLGEKKEKFKILQNQQLQTLSKTNSAKSALAHIVISSIHKMIISRIPEFVILFPCGQHNRT